MAKKPNKYLVTPPVEVIFTHIDAPDLNRKDAKGRNISDGKYKVTAILDPDDPEHAALIDTIRETADAHYEYEDEPEAKRYVPLKDEVIDKKKTGKLLLTAKSQHEPDLVDARNQSVPNMAIGWHSIVRMNISLAPFFHNSENLAGSTVYLNSLQIIDLKTNSPFDETDGFVYTGPPPATNDHDDAKDRWARTREAEDAYANPDDTGLPF